jgi:hypothetical protein
MAPYLLHRVEKKRMSIRVEKMTPFWREARLSRKRVGRMSLADQPKVEPISRSSWWMTASARMTPFSGAGVFSATFCARDLTDSSTSAKRGDRRPSYTPLSRPTA